MSNISIAESDIRQALEGIECSPVQKKALKNERLSGYLDFIVQQIINHGVAQDVTQAIRFLIQNKWLNEKQGKVTLGDMDRSSSNNELYKKIDSKQGKERKNGTTDLTRFFGTRGHASIPKLFCGELTIRFALKEKPSRIKTAEQREFVFGSGDTHRLDNRESGHQNKSTSERIALKHIKVIHKLWYRVVSTMKSDMFPMYKKEYLVLLEKLRLVFGSELDDLKKVGQKNAQAEYLFFLSVLTWATTLTYYQSFGTKILFREVTLFPYHYDVSLGRIDALELVAIRGEAPNRKELELLKKLAPVRYDSVGHIISVMVQQFGKGLTLKIHDWKFAIGDGDNGIGKTLNVIHAEDVKSGPLLKHRRQMERYLSSVYVSYEALVNHHMSKKVSSWETTDFEISGTLHYFFPEREPIVHDVVMSSDEKRESFGKIAASYTDAEYRRKFLSVSRNWLKFGLALSEEGSAFANQNRFAQQTLPGIIETTSMAQGVHATGKVSSVIKESVIRNFVDEFEIVEQVETKSGPRLFLHVDTLFSAIEQGKIDVGKNWDFATGGFVSCFLPNHAHHGKGTPSLSITYKNGGFFKCFGACGASGHFAPDSVPKSFEGLVQPATARLQIKSFSDLQAFHVSPRHTEIMTAAQRIFQNQFLDSLGAKYLEQKRRLNPELSMKHAAGYADERSMHYLLDSGFSYDELIEYGFVVLSHNIKEHSRYSTMVDLLKKRGFSIDQITRPKMKTVQGKPKELPALPLLALNKHVTYPLDINHTVTSFYGRSVVPDCPKEHSHVKTFSKGVPQGGYNFTKAMESAVAKAKKTNDVPMIFGTEAVIDADTQMQFGDIKEGGAFVGIRNRLLWQMLATFRGGIITALNWDESKIVDGVERGQSGQRATADLVKFFKEVSFGYPVYDFTQEMVKKNPSFNDINQYWKECYEDFFVHKRTNQLVVPEMLFCKKRVL